MSELKPCPFCGNELPLHYIAMQNRYVQLISCPFCNATVSCNKFLSDKDALATWNTRPIEDALHARIIEVTHLYLQTKDAFNLVTEVLLKQDARIAELEEAQRWIPVSERLPEKSGWYRVGAINVYGEGYTDEIYFDANNSKLPWQSCVRDNIYCWLDGVPELPTPPEVQE